MGGEVRCDVVKRKRRGFATARVTRMPMRPLARDFPANRPERVGCFGKSVASRVSYIYNQPFLRIPPPAAPPISPAGTMSTGARSPSPAPAPPLATAPGPRATALQKLYSDAIAHILKTCSYTNFAACFPTPAREVPGSMKALHQQFTEKLGEQLRSNFDEILAERGVVGSLNELDGLVEDARRRRGKARAGEEMPTPYISRFDCISAQ